MKMKSLIFSLIVGAAVTLAADPSLVALVPADPGLVAGVNVDKAKTSAFGQRVLAQMNANDAGLLELIQQTGFDPRKDVHEILLVTDGKQTDRNLVLVRGTFDISKIAAAVRQKGAVEAQYKGVVLFTPEKGKQDGTVALVDSSLVMAGNDVMVKAAIDRRVQSGPAISQALQQRIAKWSLSDAWFLSTKPLSALGVNSNGKNQVVPAGLAVESIVAASAGVNLSKDVAISGEAQARSAQDAQALADLVRMVVTMARLQVGGKPEAQNALKVLDTLQVSVAGVNTTLSLTIPEELLNQAMPKKAGAQMARVR